MGPLSSEYPLNDREMADAIRQWLDMMDSYGGDAIILVEGKKDIRALKDLNLRIRAVQINKGMNLFDLISSIKSGNIPETNHPFEGTIVILTDWDRKGGMLASRLKKACLHLEVPFDMEPRRSIASLTGKWIRDLESLPAFLETVSGN